MAQITLLTGETLNVLCIGCAITGHTLPVIGDNILETTYCHVGADIEVPIPGFYVLGTKRHVRGLADLSYKEAADVMTTLAKVRLAMREALGIETVTIVQEERSTNSHFHIWLFPWADWMDKCGVDVNNLRALMTYAVEHHNTHETRIDIATMSARMRAHLARH